RVGHLPAHDGGDRFYARRRAARQRQHGEQPAALLGLPGFLRLDGSDEIRFLPRGGRVLRGGLRRRGRPPAAWRPGVFSLWTFGGWGMGRKIRVGLVYGGRSGEHEVSLQTALSVA